MRRRKRRYRTDPVPRLIGNPTGKEEPVPVGDPIHRDDPVQQLITDSGLLGLLLAGYEEELKAAEERRRVAAEEKMRKEQIEAQKRQIIEAQERQMEAQNQSLPRRRLFREKSDSRSATDRKLLKLIHKKPTFREKSSG